MPVRRACQAVRLSRAAYYRPPRSQLVRDAAVVTALNEVIARHSGWGFWKCFYRLRRAGHRWNQAADVSDDHLVDPSKRRRSVRPTMKAM